ncbi:hypothetical protein HPB50_011712 [Hyalomma asiaticum]|uniref:Uncharacterized protein n=1 Tax=Hyalomma asiaticum TaxID=266040 RepID=A0ACB7RQL2_HYAAI|nr:hypothetical protein HPB50_011712 [Hyalomma asiaticum]
MSKSNFLDVPEDSEDSYESLFLQADKEFRQFVKTLSNDAGAPKLKSKSIKPAPGFCVKTKDTSSGSKIFINVCHTPELPEPQDISDEELMHILGSDDPTTYRVPLSLGLPHEEVDKKNYVVLKNKLYMGTMPDHSIQDRKGPLIAELPT